MVVEMKKVSFLIYHKEYMDVLNAIRDLGVLHVIEKERGAINDPDLEDLILEANKAKEAIKILTHYRDKEAAEKLNVKLNFDLPASLAKLDDLSDKRDKLNQQKQLFLKEYDQLSTWGNFQPESLDRLREIGYHIDFFTCSAKNFSDQWVEDYNATIITNIGSTYYFITISKDIVEIDAERVKLPNISLEEVKKEIDGFDEQLQEIEDSLKAIANKELPSFEKALRQLTGEIEFSKVLMDTKSLADQKLMLLEGWVPSDKTTALEDYFKDKSIYFEITDKQEGDVPPVLLKNSRFARLFEPITKIFSLPGYEELDLTPYLAPFFILFFGFCTGDAGYGLLIVLFCTFAKKKLAAYRDYLSLGQWLGAGAILFGILSGTFFGIELAKIPALARFREFFLSMDNLMALSIILGGIQVIFGMALHAANQTKQKGFKFAISRIGWIMILLSLLVVVGLPELKIAVPSFVRIFAYGTLSVGAIAAFLYNSPGKNIFYNFGGGLWDSYNMATGILGDLLSYIRLFALGLTGGILGNVFNQLSVDMSPDIPVIGLIITILILLVGHTIAFGLTILGAFIHPLRLTFVEFYKNAGFEGGGKAYKPFKKVK